jgi:hypothetical protein
MTTSETVLDDLMGAMRKQHDLLRMVPERWAAPDPDTLATIPKGGVNLSYMGHAEVTLALIAVDPCWTWEPVKMDDETGGPTITKHGNRLTMWGYLTVCGVRRLCVGTCEDRKSDPEKELIGDLLRNGAMRFGIGTKLWSKGHGVDPAGSGPEGGYDTGPPAPDPIADLYGRIKAATGTPVAAELKKLATENGRKLSPADLASDDRWFELVTATLDGADNA